MNNSKYKKKLTEAQQQMVVAHMGMVKSYISVQTHKHMRGDLYSAGLEGLCRAALKWAPEKGSFKNYAGIWIRALIYETFRKSITAQTINTRAGRILYYSIPMVQNDFFKTHGREATAKEIAEFTGFPVDEVETQMVVRQQVAVTEDQQPDFCSVRVVDPNDIEFSIIEKDIYEKRQALLKTAMADLPDRDQEIIKRKHSNECETFKEIGEDLRITRERVRQLHDRSFAKIQNSVASYTELIG